MVAEDTKKYSMIFPERRGFLRGWTILITLSIILLLEVFLIVKERYVFINSKRKCTPKYMGHIHQVPRGETLKLKPQ